MAVSRVIAAPPDRIFAVLDDPAKHPVIDGSGTVRRSRDEGPPRHMVLGDRFGMDMRLGMPYRVSNEVKEYEKDRLIAWANLGGQRWRYRLEPTDGGTRVTEEFDWSTAKAPWLVSMMGFPKRHPPAMQKTLERLEREVLSNPA